MFRARVVVIAVAVLAALLAPAAYASSDQPAIPCVPRVLVLSAMPLELDPLMRDPSFHLSRTVPTQGHTIYFGELGGKQVALAMTGIGMVNAAQTTSAAFDLVGDCAFKATLFSGVAGSSASIGDVVVPSTWRVAGDANGIAADGDLFEVASNLQSPKDYTLSNATPVGDAACACPEVADPGTPIVVPPPTLVKGGTGTTSDMFSGRAIPCLPGGGDVAGCAPCVQRTTVQDAGAFVRKTPALLDQEFVQAFLQEPDSSTTDAAQDMETTAWAMVAHDKGIPFLGIRAVSDGKGDPLGLPGFPAQFFVYRRLAADNAAAIAVAVLRNMTMPA